MIKKKGSIQVIEIDLLGPQGNALCLLSVANSLSRRLGKNFDDIKKRMMSGDYENLISVFDEEFGDFVILYR